MKEGKQAFMLQGCFVIWNQQPTCHMQDFLNSATLSSRLGMIFLLLDNAIFVLIITMMWEIFYARGFWKVQDASQNSRLPPPFMEKSILNFHFDYWNTSLREDLNRKKTFSFGHCPNPLTPPPDPNSGNLVLFFGRQKRRFARMTGIFFWWW